MKLSKNGCDLSTCFMCLHCLSPWKKAIESHKTNFQFKKGEVLFKEGDEVKGIYFVYSGTVKVHKQWGSDKELIIRFAKEGDIVGHRGLSGKHTVYPVSATAIEPLIACYVDLDFFNSTLKVNEDWLYKLMLFFADELQESERKMRNLAHMPVKGRIAQAVLTLLEKFGKDEKGFININLSRQDLASYSGTTYETVFRILSEFLNEELISVSGKSISVIDQSKLFSYTAQTEN